MIKSYGILVLGRVQYKQIGKKEKLGHWVIKKRNLKNQTERVSYNGVLGCFRLHTWVDQTELNQDP